MPDVGLSLFLDRNYSEVVGINSKGEVKPQRGGDNSNTTHSQGDKSN